MRAKYAPSTNRHDESARLNTIALEQFRAQALEFDCGQEFAYDWQQMKVITSPERHREQMAELAKHPA